ncbi:hypothetical protein CERZMDRAFT_94126 [Cercospora zeae-maydis SCOH1-5]|uniref:Isochorismatase-like domain-containing protein n=1 Tax=Cercospora zeae-maydis SCOH1-5 TaxID=717836 RepID=A0A6A6FQW7_9PEZI|nr:hypothetical protein CERZMDRAFT_94126 [Cercospora zeae-maydis SCOH1-5]
MPPPNWQSSNVSLFNASDISSPGYYAPAKTALLLADFHSYIIDNAVGANGTAAAANAAALRTWAKSRGIAVVHSLLDLHAAPFATCKNAAGIEAVVQTMTSTGSGTEPAELTSGSPDTTFTRQPGTVSAFLAPGLEQYLRTLNIASILLTGLSTSGTVLRTAASATDAQFVVTTISDACADPDAAVQDVLVNQVLGASGYVATTAQFRAGYDAVQH